MFLEELGSNNNGFENLNCCVETQLLAENFENSLTRKFVIETVQTYSDFDLNLFIDPF
jgi:hypothetical protein